MTVGIEVKVRIGGKVYTISGQDVLGEFIAKEIKGAIAELKKK